MRGKQVLALFFYSIVVVTGNLRQKLNYPQFLVGKTHVFDFEIATTAGVPGMRPQVAKAVFEAEVRIYAESQQHLVLSMQNVLVSGSRAFVESDAASVVLKPDKHLESHLKVPIKFIYENGMVKNYTLDPKETLESQKIKRTILRNLEVYLDSKVFHPETAEDFPVTYNTTKLSSAGNYSAHYIITSSPYNEFSRDIKVFNISRMDNYEVISYPTYRTHSNFMKTGCPTACRTDNMENAFDSGCPLGYEPYQKLMNRAFVQNHNLKMVEQEFLIIDNVITKETHVANLYDQHMEIKIRSSLTLKEISSEKIIQRKGQKEFTDLDDFSNEINEAEIKKLCGHPDPTKALQVAKELLVLLTEIVSITDLERPETKQVAEYLLLLRNALSVLNQGDFIDLQESIVRYDGLDKAQAYDKVKRQIWLDMLPVIGTPESISYITHVIRENMNRSNKVLSLWEASSILASLPDNILHVDEKTIEEFSKLIDLLHNHQDPGYTIFYSASHLAFARTVKKYCNSKRDVQENITESESRPIPSELNLLQRRLRTSAANNKALELTCKNEVVHNFVQKITDKLKTTNDKSKRLIYIETLTRTGLREILPYLEPFIYGRISSLTPNHLDFLKVSTIKSLYNAVDLYPDEIRRLVKPVFFNQSESFKVRIVAFGVLLKSAPSLGLLQQIAELSWRERSQEVGSYVTSALETYGNSSLPCHQFLSHRIKKVLPQFKRFNIGYHHSKSLMWSLFDDIRGFGLAKYLQYSASNESIVPSTVYGGFEYNIDSFRDFIFQYSANIQGIKGSKVYEKILRYFGMKSTDYIPREKELHIFPQVKIGASEPESWRIALYHKLFYSTFFNYFDDEEMKGLINIVTDHLHRYLEMNAEGNIEGRLVKIYMPSAYGTSTIGHAFPSRIQFNMENPLLFSVKVILQKQVVKKSSKFSLTIEPSIYSSTSYTSQILNLNDCKNIGVYHESQSSFVHSFNISFGVEDNGKYGLSYMFPQLPQKILTYRSEAGTYTGYGNLTVLSKMKDRAPILTIPAPFKRERKWDIPALPPFSINILTEDLMEETEKFPRDLKKALIFIITKYRNSGWRKKSVEIKQIKGGNLWSENTEVSVSINHMRVFKSFCSYQETPMEQLIRQLDINYFSNKANVKMFQREGLILFNALDEDEPHVEDTVFFEITQTEKNRTLSSARVKFSYKHTFDHMMQFYRAEFTGKTHKMAKPVTGSFDFLAILIGAPNPFRYDDDSYNKQAGFLISGITFGEGGPFENFSVAVKGLMHYKPLNGTLIDELSKPIDFEKFLPENHYECLHDIEKGKSLSVSCMKAYRERALYNHMWLKIESEKIKAKTYENAVQHLDLTLKSLFQNDIKVMPKNKAEPRLNINISATYIDKLTDHPLYQIFIEKPTELVKFRAKSPDLLPPFSSSARIVDSILLKSTNNSYPATCALMNKSVLPYDMQSYNLPGDIPVCTYVVSMHCMDQKKFAVLASIDSESGSTKEIRMYIGNETLVLNRQKKQGHFVVNFNGIENIVSPLSPIILLDGAIIAAYLADSDKEDSSIIEVDARGAGIKILYNGINMLLRVNPLYKGELCGLCGDFNGDIAREFRGMDGCLYSHAEDFAKTSIIGNCVDKTPFHPYICDDGDSLHHPKNREQKQERVKDKNKESGIFHFRHQRNSVRMVKRTIILTHEDKFCFSLKPQAMCEGTNAPLESVNEDVEFTCLPKSDPTSRNRVKEAKTRILNELRNEASDLVKTILIPRRC